MACLSISFLSTLRVAIQGPGAPARYASCRQFRDEFHTLNIERSRLGQLARLDIAEPSFLKEDFAAVDSGKQVSPRIRQSSNIDGEVDDPDVTVIGSDARFLEGEVDERPRHDRLTSYPDSLTEQMCKALGEEDEHEAELQRSHTRRRTPHMDEVSKKLEKNRSRLRKAAQDVEDGCNLLKEVHDAVQKTKDRVGQYANVMSKELNNRVMAIRRHFENPHSFTQFLTGHASGKLNQGNRGREQGNQAIYPSGLPKRPRSAGSAELTH